MKQNKKYVNDPSETKKQQKKLSPLEGISRGLMYSAIVIESIVLIIACFLFGFFLDRWTNYSPVFTLLFLFIGCCGGLYILIRLARKLEKEHTSQS